MNEKVDSGHSVNTVNCRSRTGYIVFLNCAPIYWMTNRQTIVESSYFGFEFIAINIYCEYLQGLRYKLKMMVIPCDGPYYIYGD